MKKLISALMALSLFSNVTFADCNFKTDITPQQDGSYKYSADCHLRVGSMVKQLDTQSKQLADLDKAIELKDLAITTSDQRTQLWMDTSFKLEQRMETIVDLRDKNNWLYFGIGALTILASGYMASQLIRH